MHFLHLNNLCLFTKMGSEEKYLEFLLIFKRYHATAKLLQSCPTLCDPIDGSPLGSPVPGILQARTLEGVAIAFSNAWKWKVKVKSLSGIRLLATPWTVAHQAPPSMGFSRQEYRSGQLLWMQKIHKQPTISNRRRFYFSCTENHSGGFSLSVVLRNWSGKHGFQHILYFVRAKYIHQTWHENIASKFQETD